MSAKATGKTTPKARIVADVTLDQVFGGGDPWPSMSWTMGVAATLALLLFVAIRVLGMRQFGAEDGGITADLAYMVKLGYRPYTEIQTTGFPPFYFMLGGLAFKVLGVRWESLVTLAGAFAALALVSQTWLLSKAGFGRMTALAVATFTQCATMLPLSNWWYNQTTSVLGALFASAALALVVRPKDKGIWGAFVASALLLSWSKANVAALLLLGVGVALLLNKRTRIVGPALLLGAGALSLAGLVLVGIDPRLVIQSYLGASARVSGGNFSAFFWVNDHVEAVRTLWLLVPALAAGIVCLVGWALSGKKRIIGLLSFAAIALVAVITGLVAMGTNNDHNLVETPLIVLGCVVLARIAGAIKESAWRWVVVGALAVSIVGLGATGVWSGVTRGRIMSIGGGLFYEDVAITPTGGSPMMANVATGPAFKQAVSDVQAVLAANPKLAAPDANVYFGPRLLVMYPEFGIAPPKGIPSWWGLYPDGMAATAALVGRFQELKPTLAVFYNNDYTFYPNSLGNLLYTEYDVYRWNTLTLHVLKGSGIEVPAGAVKVK